MKKMLLTMFSRADLGQLCNMCQVIRWLLMTFLVVQIGFFAVAWFVPMPLRLGPLLVQLSPEGLTDDAVLGLSLLQKVLGIAFGLPGLATLTYGVRRLGQTLRRFQRGAIFDADTIGHLRGFAGATLFSAILFNIEKPLRAMAFNLASDNWTYPVTVDVTSNELMLILVCSLFYLMAGVMHEGRRLAEENEGFI